LLALAALGWTISRERLVARRPVTVTEELAGHTAALLALGIVGLLVVATNPYSLVLVLPSLHAWLWLPQVQSRALWLRAAIFALGFLGPLVLLASLAARYGLGLDAPWYVLELAALHYIPLPSLVIGLAWLAATAQLAALAAGRYAPYPSATERPELQPVRSAIRRFIVSRRTRRREIAQGKRAHEG
jgi:hypothetical protein